MRILRITTTTAKAKKEKNFSSVGLGREQKTNWALPLLNDSQVSQHKVIAKTQFNITSDFEFVTYRDTNESLNHTAL